MDLSLYRAEISAVAGSGRDHTAPQLLISLWLYAYSQGTSSARELARRCEFEPGFQWLCGLNPISQIRRHDTSLSEIDLTQPTINDLQAIAD
jgi:transposase